MLEEYFNFSEFWDKEFDVLANTKVEWLQQLEDMETNFDDCNNEEVASFLVTQVLPISIDNCEVDLEAKTILILFEDYSMSMTDCGMESYACGYSFRFNMTDSRLIDVTYEG